MDVLVEELIDLHSSCDSFRRLFISQQTTTLFIDAAKSFVDKVAADPNLRSKHVRIVEKLTHLVLLIALDSAVEASQKREVCVSHSRRGGD